jgi:hypothetical protein
MVHSLSAQTGADVGIAPSSFLPANAKATSLFYSDGVVYASTSNDCAGVSNGVWAIDLGSPEKAVTSWKTNSGSVTGTAGPTFGADGTVYVAVGSGSGSNGSYSNSVVALEPKTLKLRDYFTEPGADFNASPVVFDYKGKDLVIASAKDGRMFVLNSTSLGGTDHHTPLSVTPPGNVSTEEAGALASWQDTGGTRWVLAPATNAIVAFRLTDANGITALQQGWVSRNMVSPLPPIVVNGVVFTLSSGEYRGGGQITVAQHAQRSTPATLYALDAVMGKELWNSGNTITSFAHGGGLAAGAGQVYLTTFDNTLYAFGFPIEH